jgi:hypothetical protein
VTEPDPFMHRASSHLRTAPEPGWDAISDRVRAAVNAAARTAWPIRASSGTGNRGAIYITDQALRSLLARELRRRFVCQPTRISFTLDGELLRAIDIEVTGSYGTQLRELGDDIRRAVFATIGEIIDDSSQESAGPIDVTISDVVDGDPLQR